MKLISNLAKQLSKPERGIYGWLTVNLMIFINREINDLTINALGIQANDQILEIGFGPGRSIRKAARLAQCGWVAGIDRSPYMVQWASNLNQTAIAQGRVQLRCGNVMSLPYEDETFDKVFSVHNFYFWPEPVSALCNIRRILKPGGQLVISADFTESPITRTETVYRLYDSEDLGSLFTKVGFADFRIEELSSSFSQVFTVAWATVS